MRVPSISSHANLYPNERARHTWASARMRVATTHVRACARRPIQAVRFSSRSRSDGFQTSFEFLLCCDLEEDHKIAAETPQRQFINI